MYELRVTHIYCILSSLCLCNQSCDYYTYTRSHVWQAPAMRTLIYVYLVHSNHSAGKSSIGTLAETILESRHPNPAASLQKSHLGSYLKAGRQEGHQCSILTVHNQTTQTLPAIKTQSRKKSEQYVFNSHP